jgi:hypothetical protein
LLGHQHVDGEGNPELAVGSATNTAIAHACSPTRTACSRCTSTRRCVLTSYGTTEPPRASRRSRSYAFGTGVTTWAVTLTLKRDRMAESTMMNPMRYRNVLQRAERGRAVVVGRNRSGGPTLSAGRTVRKAPRRGSHPP